MIKLAHVTKHYGSITALDDLSLEVAEGECLVLIGPSGCGKSTLLKTINRLVEPDQGDIAINQKPIRDYAPEILRRHIGYCIQGVGLFPHLSVFDNIAVVPRLLKWENKPIKDRVDELMTLTGLPLSYQTKRPHQLSGGEAQRVGVCRALAADPDVLLMDEPFGAVDPMTREQIQLAFRELQRRLKKTVLFVTHDLEEAILLGDRIALMHRGKILELSTPENLGQQSTNDTVTQFLGADYALRILRRSTVDELSLTEVMPQPDDRELDPQTSLKDALAVILEAGSTRVITRRDEVTRLIDLEAIAAHLRKVRHG
jgi:osmoprotectant transport system ATP-binding protein